MLDSKLYSVPFICLSYSDWVLYPISHKKKNSFLLRNTLCSNHLVFVGNISKFGTVRNNVRGSIPDFSSTWPNGKMVDGIWCRYNRFGDYNQWQIFSEVHILRPYMTNIRIIRNNYIVISDLGLLKHILDVLWHIIEYRRTYYRGSVPTVGFENAVTNNKLGGGGVRGW